MDARCCEQVVPHTASTRPMLTYGLKRCDIPQIKKKSPSYWDSRRLLKRMKKTQYSDLPHVQDFLFLLREIVFGQNSS
jgi:hypothetical protein